MFGWNLFNIRGGHQSDTRDIGSSNVLTLRWRAMQLHIIRVWWCGVYFFILSNYIQHQSLVLVRCYMVHGVVHGTWCAVWYMLLVKWWLVVQALLGSRSISGPIVWLRDTKSLIDTLNLKILDARTVLWWALKIRLNFPNFLSLQSIALWTAIWTMIITPVRNFHATRQILLSPLFCCVPQSWCYT